MARRPLNIAGSGFIDCAEVDQEHQVDKKMPRGFLAFDHGDGKYEFVPHCSMRARLFQNIKPEIITALYVRGDIACEKMLPPIPAIVPGCWTRLEGLSLAGKYAVAAAYINALHAGEGSIPPGFNHFKHIYVGLDGCLDFVDSVSHMEACLEGIEKEVPAIEIIAALPLLLRMENYG